MLLRRVVRATGDCLLVIRFLLPGFVGLLLHVAAFSACPHGKFVSVTLTPLTGSESASSWRKLPGPHSALVVCPKPGSVTSNCWFLVFSFWFLTSPHFPLAITANSRPSQFFRGAFTRSGPACYSTCCRPFWNPWAPIFSVGFTEQLPCCSASCSFRLIFRVLSVSRLPAWTLAILTVSDVVSFYPFRYSRIFSLHFVATCRRSSTSNPGFTRGRMRARTCTASCYGNTSALECSPGSQVPNFTIIQILMSPNHKKGPRASSCRLFPELIIQ